ncbi:MAG: AMP-binding protein [Bifidobacteriaceae bacterium]|nr:AMP-binding protein [Bifidobacteriaceae bacterium]
MLTRQLIDRLSRALDGGAPVIIGQEARADVIPALPPGTALTLPTSGSTGHPKLVALSAAAIRASAQASAERLGGIGHWLLALPPTHIAGLNVIARALLAGAPPTVMAPGPFSTKSFAAAVAALPPGPSYVSLVPTQLRRLVEAGPEGTDQLRSFAAVLVGGAALDPALRRTAEASGARLVVTYGAAETGGGCVYDGVPLSGVDLALEPGGRIAIAGPTLALGYVDSDQNGFAERSGKLWFTTSDLGRWAPDGRLEVIGRADNAITSGGQTIAPEPVEAIIAALPGVAQVLVVGLPSEFWGEAVTALVVPDADHSPSLPQLRQAVKQRLGPPSAPQGLGLVEDLPWLAPGKPDRLAARELAASLAASGRLDSAIR